MSITLIFQTVLALFKAVPVLQEAFFGFIDWWYKTQSEADTKRLKEGLAAIQKPGVSKEETKEALKKIVRGSF